LQYPDLSGELPVLCGELQRFSGGGMQLTTNIVHFTTKNVLGCSRVLLSAYQNQDGNERGKDYED